MYAVKRNHPSDLKMEIERQEQEFERKNRDVPFGAGLEGIKDQKVVEKMSKQKRQKLQKMKMMKDSDTESDDSAVSADSFDAPKPEGKRKNLRRIKSQKNREKNKKFKKSRHILHSDSPQHRNIRSSGLRTTKKGKQKFKPLKPLSVVEPAVARCRNLAHSGFSSNKSTLLAYRFGMNRNCGNPWNNNTINQMMITHKSDSYQMTVTCFFQTSSNRLSSFHSTYYPSDQASLIEISSPLNMLDALGHQFSSLLSGDSQLQRILNYVSLDFSRMKISSQSKPTDVELFDIWLCLPQTLQKNILKIYLKDPVFFMKMITSFASSKLCQNMLLFQSPSLAIIHEPFPSQEESHLLVDCTFFSTSGLKLQASEITTGASTQTEEVKPDYCPQACSAYNCQSLKGCIVKDIEGHHIPKEKLIQLFNDDYTELYFHSGISQNDGCYGLSASEDFLVLDMPSYKDANNDSLLKGKDAIGVPLQRRKVSEVSWSPLKEDFVPDCWDDYLPSDEEDDTSNSTVDYDVSCINTCKPLITMPGKEFFTDIDIEREVMQEQKSETNVSDHPAEIVDNLLEVNNKNTATVSQTQVTALDSRKANVQSQVDINPYDWFEGELHAMQSGGEISSEMLQHSTQTTVKEQQNEDFLNIEKKCPNRIYMKRQQSKDSLAITDSVREKSHGKEWVASNNDSCNKSQEGKFRHTPGVTHYLHQAHLENNIENSNGKLEYASTLNKTYRLLKASSESPTVSSESVIMMEKLDNNPSYNQMADHWHNNNIPANIRHYTEVKEVLNDDMFKNDNGIVLLNHICPTFSNAYNSEPFQNTASACKVHHNNENVRSPVYHTALSLPTAGTTEIQVSEHISNMLKHQEEMVEYPYTNLTYGKLESLPQHQSFTTEDLSQTQKPFSTYLPFDVQSVPLSRFNALVPPKLSSSFVIPAASNSQTTDPDLHILPLTLQQRLLLLLTDLQTEILALAKKSRTTIKDTLVGVKDATVSVDVLKHSLRSEKELSFDQIEAVLDKYFAENAKHINSVPKNSSANLTNQGTCGKITFPSEQCKRSKHQKEISEAEMNKILNKLPLLESDAWKLCHARKLKTTSYSKQDPVYKLCDMNHNRFQSSELLLKKQLPVPSKENWSEGINTDLQLHTLQVLEPRKTLYAHRSSRPLNPEAEVFVVNKSRQSHQGCNNSLLKSSTSRKPTKPYAVARALFSDLKKDAALQKVESSHYNFRLPPVSQRPILSISKSLPKIAGEFKHI